MSSFYVTTPIYYVNDRPHLGHAYTSIAADALARWRRMEGQDAWMLTGTDEHGQKVFESATRRGLTPQAHVDELHVAFKDLLTAVSVENNDFIRTTDARHTSVVRDVLQMLWDRDDIYADHYEGWYSTSAERFWTEKDLVDGKCPETGQAVEWIKERNYFFRMSKYADRFRAWMADKPEFVRPASRRNEVLGLLKKDVGDLCISRPKTRLPWGIELPFAPDYVTYVWFDALLNYLTAIGYHPDPSKRGPDFDRRWPADFHLVGKDILTTHSLYWCTMLFALDLEPARCLYAHGWWTIEGRKMSKSLGNVVDPHLLVDAYGADALRYFLLREIHFGNDGDFSHAGFLTRYNADLANDLGNLAHRALSMTGKWLGGVVPALDDETPNDTALRELTERTAQTFSAGFSELQFSHALEALWELVRAGNKYIDTEQPWALNRQGDMARLGGVLRRCMEICRVAATMLSPVCPQKAVELAAKLGVQTLDRATIGRLDGLVDGTPVVAGAPLFPRMLELPESVSALLGTALAEADAEAAHKKALKAKKSQQSASGGNKVKTMSETPASAVPEAPEAPAEVQIPRIKIDDFSKIALRAGKVLTAEKHPKADRLLVLSVDLGEENPRSIVAGLATRYAPEELVGQTVVVVANLKPAKLRGVKSEGMVLAAGGDAGVQGLLTVNADVAPGTVIR